MNKKYAKWLEQLQVIREIPIRWHNTQDSEPEWGNGGKCDWEQLDDKAPRYGGVYVFWWVGEGEKSASSLFCGQTLHFKGPKVKDEDKVKEPKDKEEIRLSVEEKHLAPAANGYVPVYVGKSFATLAERIGKHLNLGTQRVVDVDLCNQVSPRKTTSNQVRDRLDRLSPKTVDTRELLSNLKISWVKLDGRDHFVDRFYLEDLAIGQWRPLFNLDCER